jgi:hypothetical protein
MNLSWKGLTSTKKTRWLNYNTTRAYIWNIGWIVLIPISSLRKSPTKINLRMVPSDFMVIGSNPFLISRSSIMTEVLSSNFYLWTTKVIAGKDYICFFTKFFLNTVTSTSLVLANFTLVIFGSSFSSSVFNNLEPVSRFLFETIAFSWFSSSDLSLT